MKKRANLMMWKVGNIVEEDINVKAQFINENMRFEKTGDPKKGMSIGRDRFRRPGDEDIIDGFVYRDHPDGGPSQIIVNLSNGKEFEVGLYAAREVKNALIELLG